MNPFTTLAKNIPDTLEHGDQWRRNAACIDEDPELFFPAGETGSHSVQAEDAKAVCRACPVTEQCLNWAMEQGQQSGIWGGTTEKERANMRRRQARAGETTPRVPIAQYDTDPEAYMASTAIDNGHVVWTGGNEVRVNGKRRSPNQVAWRATFGRAPVGQVLIDCDRNGCVQHLTDTEMRHKRAQKQRTA